MKTNHRILFLTAIAAVVCSTTNCNREAKAANHVAAARKYDQSGDMLSAEIKYKNALEEQPGLPEALKGLGLTLQRQGAYLAAAGYLSEAKPKLPVDNEIGFNLARALLAMGFVADSRKELLDLLSRSPDHGEALLLLAETSLTPDEFTECEERIERAKPGDPSSVPLAKALISIRRGGIEEGSSLVRQALEQAPRSPQAHAFQANLFKKAGDKTKAMESMKMASDLAGPRSDERIQYAMLLMEQGEISNSRQLLESSLQTAPDYLPALRQLASVELACGNEEKALSCLAKALGKSPLDLEAALLRSQILTNRKEHKQAIELLEKLDETYPSRPNLELALAKACLAAGAYRRGAELLDRVLGKIPTATEAIILRAGVHLKDNQPGQAISLLEPLASAAPDNRVAQDLLVMSYQSANRLADATATVARQSKAAPEDAELLVKHGFLLRAQGKHAEARETLEKALTIKADMIGAIAQLAYLDQSEGNTATAVSRIDDYLKHHPDSAEAYLIKAGLFITQKNYKGAEVAALRSLEIKPDQPAAYGLLVLVQVADGRMEAAVEKLGELINRNPANLSARMYRGALFRELGNAASARSEFEEILKRDPNFAAAYNDLAWLESGDPKMIEQAWEHARKARTLRPNDPAIADTYGWIQLLKGDYRPALNTLSQSAGQLPDQPTIQYHLAVAHAMMFQIPQAVTAIEMALASPGKFPERPRAESLLAMLRDPGKHTGSDAGTEGVASPEAVVTLIAKARDFQQSGNSEQAADFYQKALAINPDIGAAHLGLAQVHSDSTSQSELAMRSALRARELTPDDPHSAATLGKLTFRSGKHHEAYSLLNWAANQLPGVTTVQIDYALAAYSIGKVEKARSIMTKHTKAPPPMGKDATDFLIMTDPDAPNNPEAVVAAEAKLSQNPTDVPSLMLRAARLTGAGESPIPVYIKILEVYSKFTPARIALAKEYLADPAKLQAADELINVPGGSVESDPQTRSVAALVNFKMGRFDYVAVLLKELSAERELQAGESYALGMSLANTHRPEEARVQLTRALLAGLPDEEAAMARSTLESLDQKSVK